MSRPPPVPLIGHGPFARLRRRAAGKAESLEERSLRGGESVTNPCFTFSKFLIFRGLSQAFSWGRADTLFLGEVKECFLNFGGIVGNAGARKSKINNS